MQLELDLFWWKKLLKYTQLDCLQMSDTAVTLKSSQGYPKQYENGSSSKSMIMQSLFWSHLHLTLSSQNKKGCWISWHPKKKLCLTLTKVRCLPHQRWINQWHLHLHQFDDPDLVTFSQKTGYIYLIYLSISLSIYLIGQCQKAVLPSPAPSATVPRLWWDLRDESYFFTCTYTHCLTTLTNGVFESIVSHFPLC